MIYLTGIHALNIPCGLETCGDWHAPALKWEKLILRDSDKMFFKTYGIEKSLKSVPDHEEKYYVANHIRALLDLISEGNFAVAQGMNNDFICNPKYDSEIFNAVYKLRKDPLWTDIDSFMTREYKIKWIDWKERREKDARLEKETQAGN